MARATTPTASGKERGTKSAGGGAGRDGARPPGRGGSGRDGGRPPARPQPGAPTGGDGSYLAGVVSELRKVTWPTMPDLARMTQVVIATVIIFAALIGGLDFVLGLVAKPLYTQQGTAVPSSSSLSHPVPTLRPDTTPRPSATTGGSPAPSVSSSAATTSSGSATSTVTPTARP